jgi:hypothetical protein
MMASPKSVKRGFAVSGLPELTPQTPLGHQTAPSRGSPDATSGAGRAPPLPGPPRTPDGGDAAVAAGGGGGRQQMPPLLTHWFTTGQAGQLHAAGVGGDDVGAKAGPPHLAGSGGGDNAPDAGQTRASNAGGAAAAAGQPQVSNPDGGTGADSAAGRPHASDASGDADAGTGAGQPHTGSGNDVGAAARAAVTPTGMPVRGSTWLTGNCWPSSRPPPGPKMCA